MRVSIALIALALVIVAFIQFFWFRQSATMELEESLHSLYATVTQTFSREYQRYAPVIAGLRELSSDGAAAPDKAKAALERLYGLYGPSGSIPGLVASVGIASLADMTETSTLGADRQWKSIQSEFLIPVPNEIVRQLTEGKLVFYDGPRAEEWQFILVRAGRASIAVTKIDASFFFATYIKPALSSALPGATIEWADATPQDRANEAAANLRNGKKRSQFNPFSTLLGLRSKERRTFSVSLPVTMDTYAMHGGSSGSEGTKEDETKYRILPGGKDRVYRNDSRMKSASIVMPEGSAMVMRELRLSLVWLLSVIFLIGIGFAFAQTILQKHKLKTVGEREREFVASVTHELRTPVTAIKTAAFNMREGLVGPERMATYGEMIYSQSLRLASMIEEMLLFSKVEGRKGQISALGEIASADLLGELRPPLDEIALSSGIRLSWNFGALPERFVGDAEAIRVILNNLVANALYHAYPPYSGGETGEVRVISRIRMPEKLQFLVEDDGRGIAKAEAKLVFEPFYRDEESRSNHEKGSGLGLFIASRKAEMLGGKLELESPYKRIDEARRPGCRFTLELPFKEPDDVR